jgi:hypothetical protein
VNFSKQEIYIGSILIVISIFIGLLLAAANSSPQVTSIGALILPCIALCFSRPRLALWIFLIYLPFTGTINYSIASLFQAVGGEITFNQDYVIFQILKDAFYLPALLGICLTTSTFAKFARNNRYFLYAVAGLLCTALLTLLFVNFYQQLSAKGGDRPFMMGFVGLKILLGYIPLVLCGYFLIHDRRDLRWLGRLQMILAIVCCGLTLIQYLYLKFGFCAGSIELPEPAYFRASLQARCFVGGSLLYNPPLGLIRLPGTFSSPWQWSWFLIANSFFVFFASYIETVKRWKIVNIIGIILLLATVIISGQRLAFILVPLILLSLFLITNKYNFNKAFATKLGIIVAVFIILLYSPLFQEQLNNFVERWNYSPPDKFVLEQFEWANNKLELFGNGLGRASSAARKFGKIQGIETFYPLLLYEIGIVGTIVYLTVVSSLTWLTFRAYRSLKDKYLRKLGLCLWIFILFISYNTYYYPLAVDPISVYYWFFAGVLLKLPEIENNNESLLEDTGKIEDNNIDREIV